MAIACGRFVALRETIVAKEPRAEGKPLLRIAKAVSGRISVGDEAVFKRGMRLLAYCEQALVAGGKGKASRTAVDGEYWLSPEAEGDFDPSAAIAVGVVATV